ncbi:hypothetical protein [Hydromonas duriensis]|uniref:Uncharacterized protein n=1 Tax=Hydromonas duriensis TaxID=1527608 RepID=A0A4R6Y774_9BURK|nr:hypothetical protein [Hydromonas duriensis]TDR31168.1 hypothetical protein DFR44_11237 [Hydromonas duriensis]
MERKVKMMVAGLAAVVGLGMAGLAVAKDDGHGMMGHKGMKMGGPMGEAAVAACANQAEGANVMLEHPNWGKIDAVCTKTPDGKIAAMPAKMVEHMKAAQAACSGKKEGDKVTIASPMEQGKMVEATCKKHGDVLAAHPAHKGKMGHHGDMMPPPAQ